MIEFDLKATPRDVVMKRIFRIVQEIPFRFGDYEGFDNKKNACKETVTSNIETGDSRHKSDLLYNLLMQANFEAEKTKVIFDWSDLAIPEEILSILKKSTTRQAFDIVNVKLSDYCKSYVDPTWNYELKELGFPVTGEWDGKGSTTQITEGELEYCPLEEFRPGDYDIVTDKDEYEEFMNAVNSWLEASA